MHSEDDVWWNSVGTASRQFFHRSQWFHIFPWDYSLIFWDSNSRQIPGLFFTCLWYCSLSVLNYDEVLKEGLETASNSIQLLMVVVASLEKYFEIFQNELWSFFDVSRGSGEVYVRHCRNKHPSPTETHMHTPENNWHF